MFLFLFSMFSFHFKDYRLSCVIHCSSAPPYFGIAAVEFDFVFSRFIHQTPLEDYILAITSLFFLNVNVFFFVTSISCDNLSAAVLILPSWFFRDSFLFFFISAQIWHIRKPTPREKIKLTFKFELHNLQLRSRGNAMERRQPVGRVALSFPGLHHDLWHSSNLCDSTYIRCYKLFTEADEIP